MAGAGGSQVKNLSDSLTRETKQKQQRGMKVRKKPDRLNI